MIVVEDDGSGFDAAEINESHMTLTNIRQRLELMCEGKMEITSKAGGGTVVTVTIPDRSNEETGTEESGTVLFSHFMRPSTPFRAGRAKSSAENQNRT